MTAFFSHPTAGTGAAAPVCFNCRPDFNPSDINSLLIIQIVIADPQRVPNPGDKSIGHIFNVFMHIFLPISLRGKSCDRCYSERGERGHRAKADLLQVTLPTLFLEPCPRGPYPGPSCQQFQPTHAHVFPLLFPMSYSWSVMWSLHLMVFDLALKTSYILGKYKIAQQFSNYLVARLLCSLKNYRRPQRVLFIWIIPIEDKIDKLKNIYGDIFSFYSWGMGGRACSGNLVDRGQRWC